jgi:hypothetical protein
MEQQAASVLPVSPLERVRKGMVVIDAQHRPVGTVADVFPGYPDAVSTNEGDLASGLVGLIIAPLESTGGTTSVAIGQPIIVDRLLDEPDIPDELRLGLLRAFIELDAPDLRGAARYISGEQIAEVSDNSVCLKQGYRPYTRSAATGPSSRVVLGATVYTADGHDVGKVDRLIVDPFTLSIRPDVGERGSGMHSEHTRHDCRMRPTA